LKDVPRAIENTFGVYLGSQTHPPCKEGILWLVAERSFLTNSEDVNKVISFE